MTTALHGAPPTAATVDAIDVDAGLVDATEVEVLPASFAQARLWILDRLNPGTAAYVSDLPMRVRGPLDPSAFAQALEDVVGRHEILRTTFGAVGATAVQVVRPYLAPQVSRHDLRQSADPLAAARELARELADTPFDLANGPLVRLRVAQMAAEDWAVLLAVHHIVVDGWSLGVLLDDLHGCYQARAAGHVPDLEAPPAQYGDFSVWQHENAGGEQLAAHLSYWRERLHAAPRLQLPADYERPQLATHRGGREYVTIPTETVQRLRALAREERATLFVVLLAGYAVLLRAWSGQRDIVLGTPVSGRDQPELERMIGFFVNMLALRLDLSGQPSFRDVVRGTRQVVLDAFSRQDLPFERLVSELRPEREVGRSPFFDVTFALQHAGMSTTWPDLAVSPLSVPHAAVKFDLALTCAEVDDRIHARFAYASELFDAGTVARLAGNLVTLLAASAADPDVVISRLPLLTEGERSVLAAANDTALQIPAGSVHELFAQQARRRPDACAVTDDVTMLTYRELDARSNHLARVLQAAGVQVEQPVAVVLDSGPDLVVAELAVLKAGAAFIPIDVATPAERVAAILGRLTPTMGLTVAEHERLLPAGVAPVLVDAPGPAALPPLRDPGVGGGSLACLIATSGTTGVPKLVEVEHRSLVNHLTWINERVLVGDPDIPVVSSPSFDAVHKQLLGPLLRGGTVWLLPQERRLDASLLLGAVGSRSRVALNYVPTLWRAVLEHVESGRVVPPPALALLLLGGEAVTEELVERTFAAFPAVEVWNLYGPTETTVNALAERLLPGEPVTIGRPVGNADAHVVDSDGAELPAGVPGELHIGGVVLARGYRDAAAETVRAFGDPGAPPRRYRTGDRVVRLADGRIRFLGRIDDQVKVRGVRVELGEIQTHLRAHEAIRDAAVVVRGDEVAAYVVPLVDPVPASTLRAYLASRLHPAAIPTSYTWLAALPLTAAGKLDRALLPDPHAAAPSPTSPTLTSAARTPTEMRVAQVWTQLLNAARIGRDDNFFDLGGHSLLVVRAHARLARQTPGLSVLELFRYPTLRSLAACIDALEAPP